MVSLFTRNNMTGLVFVLMALQTISGTVIRSAAYNSPPGLAIIKKPDGNFTYVGYTKDIMDELFKYLNMTYVFVNVDAQEVVSKGITQALLDQLLRNEVDFNAYGFIPTIERVKDFDFTIPVQQDQYRFLVKYPEAESRLWGPIRPFQLPVWICFLFAIMAVILSLSWLMKCVNRKRPKPKMQGRTLTLTELVGRNAVYICTIITGQGEYFNERKLPVRILVAVWCLMALILVNSYTGNLISYLTVPRMKPVVNSFEELANSQETKLTIEAKNILSENILNAKSGPYKRLGDSLRANPQYLFKVPQEGKDIIIYRNGAYPGINLVVYYVIGSDVKDTGKCRLTLSKPLSLYQSFSFMLPKNSPHTNYFNSKLQYLWENGLMDKLRQNYRPRIDKCLANKQNKPKTAPLKLVDLYSAFVLLGFGLSLAVSAFIVELTSLRFRNKK